MGWTLLRRVPLGRAIIGTGVGTILGAVLGTIVDAPAIGGVVGYAIASLGLYATHRKPRPT
jgi:hypothetical protein